jgi:hypothetical protein
VPKYTIETLDNRQAGTEGIDAFVLSAANGTLFHRPRFLNYHSSDKQGRNSVEFRHLAFYRKGKLVGFLPGALVQDPSGVSYRSCWGASLGGLVVPPDTPFADIAWMVAAWLEKSLEWGVHQVEVTLVPICFQSQPGQETIEFAMLSQGFKYIDGSLLMAVPINQADGFPQSVFSPDSRRRIRLAAARGCQVRVTGDLDAFWPILEETMQSHGASATHTREEIDWLCHQLAESFCIHLAVVGDRPVGGMLIFQVSPRAATTFYICSRKDSREMQSVNLLCAHVLNWARERGLRWIDFGPSTFGLTPHASLIHFKEEHGGRGILRRKMQIEIATDTKRHHSAN